MSPFVSGSVPEFLDLLGAGGRLSLVLDPPAVEVPTSLDQGALQFETHGRLLLVLAAHRLELELNRVELRLERAATLPNTGASVAEHSGVEG